MLGYLPTHLTFAEIGAELFVSRHTVHSHATAIYRKFGVTSRSEAVERRSSSACPERHWPGAEPVDPPLRKGPDRNCDARGLGGVVAGEAGTDSSEDRYQSRKPMIVAPTIA